MRTSVHVFKRDIVDWTYDSSEPQNFADMCKGHPASTEAPTFLWAMLVLSIMFNLFWVYLIHRVPMLRYIVWQSMRVIPDIAIATFRSANDRYSGVELHVREAGGRQDAPALTTSVEAATSDGEVENISRCDPESQTVVWVTESSHQTPLNRGYSTRDVGEQLRTVDDGTSLGNATSSPQDTPASECEWHE